MCGLRSTLITPSTSTGIYFACSTVLLCGFDTTSRGGDNPQDPAKQEKMDGGGEYVLEQPEDFLASDDFKTLPPNKLRPRGLTVRVPTNTSLGPIAALQKAETEATA